MVKELSKKEIVDILDVLYVKILNLRYSWKSCCAIAMEPNVDNNFPDITHGVKRSFAIDAYTTIEGLLTSGKYSFKSLVFNEDFQNEFSNSKTKIKSIIPKLDDKRNRTICHFDEKQNPQNYDLIISKYYSIDEELCRLHKKAMEIFGIDYSEIRYMSNEKFQKLNEEIKDFDKVLKDAVINYELENLKE